MKINPQLTDQAILRELGARLAGMRVEHNLTQAAVAEKAGISKRTLERLETGEVATQLSGFLRVCRVLGVLEHFEALLPEPLPGPMAQLRHTGRKRQRASGKKADSAATKKWTWGEPL